MKRTSCCCDYIATPRKSSISCDPEAKLGRRSSGSAGFTCKANIQCTKSRQKARHA
ncbi:hypothetical protein ACSAZL_11230 [Methanosarcina sp. T3]|uniref:hypothetical protein n=1 Tax=Methanosarcina sp. T3 TaxID=3439062 RepID=UPI003F8647A4